MNCPHCSTPNPEYAVSCSQCGTPMPPLDTQETLQVIDLTLLKPGSDLGRRYRIESLIGQGGMGRVYKAYDKELGRTVALKIVRADLMASGDALQRFKQELILARKVTHKNVIRIFDLGEADGLKFITMDFIEGRDLKTILREKGKLTPEEAVKIIAQVCRALDAAHSEGVIHRDLKPQNIMLDNQERVIVMDFGIARSAEMPGMTQTGALVGTPEYMSPEQAKGEEVDARSDHFLLNAHWQHTFPGGHSSRHAPEENAGAGPTARRTRACRSARDQQRRDEVPGNQPGSPLCQRGRNPARSRTANTDLHPAGRGGLSCPFLDPAWT